MATTGLDKSQHIPSITESSDLQGTHKDNSLSPAPGPEQDLLKPLVQRYKTCN